MIGVVAQEIETVSPNLVEDKNKLNDILEITDTDKTITDESGNVIDNPNYGKPKPNPDFGLHIDGETYKTVKYSVLYMKLSTLQINNGKNRNIRNIKCRFN